MTPYHRQWSTDEALRRAKDRAEKGNRPGWPLQLAYRPQGEEEGR